MRYETKIALPSYKIACALFFVVMLSLVRGVTYSYEIGIAMEAPMAILAAALCADTWTQEITGRRWEIQRLYPMKKRISSIYRRLLIQELFLSAIAAAGYGLFFLFQSPGTATEDGLGGEICQFSVYLAAVVVTLFFWGLLSNLLSCLFRNMWAGTGGSLLLWLLTNSSAGDRCLGVWNLFSYTFRSVEGGDFRWVYGKIACVGMGIMAASALPGIIKHCHAPRVSLLIKKRE